MARETFYPGETFDFKIGQTEYTATIHSDDSMGEPWKEHDGHGEVSDWTTRAKLPGEMVLSEDGRSKRFYDFAEACKTARRDGWGWLPGEMVVDRFAHSGKRKWRAFVAGRLDLTVYAPDKNAAIAALYALHKSTMSPRAYAAGAAMRDFERLRDWCDDRWQWIGISVRKSTDCDCCGESQSLWGIESDCGEYALETAKELAEELAA